MALERMFDFVDLAPSVIERTETSDGALGDLFRGARETATLVLVAKRAAEHPPSALFDTGVEAGFLYQF
jgi:hypothetical protein